MKKRGFTLIELLAVIVILGVLVTLGSRSIRSARISAKKAQAMVEIKSIETAIKAYQSRYGKLPAASLLAQGSGDVEIDFNYSGSDRFHAESEEIISTLSMADDADVQYNQAEVVFLEPGGSGADGIFKDPWGYQYRIGLDTDYDGFIAVDGEEVRRSVAIISIGLFAQNDGSDTNDVIRSWQ